MYSYTVKKYYTMMTVTNTQLYHAKPTVTYNSYRLYTLTYTSTIIAFLLTSLSTTILKSLVPSSCLVSSVATLFPLITSSMHACEGMLLG